MNDKLAITNLRCLAMDTINKAKSGHPGIALGSAAILHTIYTRHMVAVTTDPKWIKRDRFVLSAGHASSLLYSVLHLCGYNVSIDDLKNFRQLDSITPGHPERSVTDGVDMSTGPLGQGIANAVGLAMAEAHLVGMYPSLKDLIEHYTYVLCGDGDLQEGVALEAMSIAGLNKLHKLIVCYDSNDITLDGPLAQSSTDNLKDKFEAMNWNVLEVSDGNLDVDAIDKAITKAKNQTEKPTIIIIKTKIGYGSTLAGSHKVHGSPLGEEGTKLLKDYLNWKEEPFTVLEEVKDLYKNTFIFRGLAAYAKYSKIRANLSAEDESNLLEILDKRTWYHGLTKGAYKYKPGYCNATRNVSGDILNLFAAKTNKLFGGSADVSGSVKTSIKNTFNFSPEHYEGKNINFGIREHAMMAIGNGIQAHGGLKGYFGSFLVFSDYARGAIRMAALMGLGVTYLFSHDSIAVGEDGPTHQPVEQLSSLRLIPNLNVIRPADAKETLGAYKIAMRSQETPTAIILSRQNLTTYEGYHVHKVKYGAYIVCKEEKHLDAILLASGSEVELAILAREKLLKKGIDCRVVSMPSMFMFNKQTVPYKKDILPNRDITLAIEMGNGDLYYKYAANVMDIKKFGKSAKATDVIKDYKFTVSEVVKRVRNIIK